MSARQMFENMMRVVRADCGSSVLQAEMMLSLVSTSNKVSINEIISRIDRPNFNAFLELCNMARDSNDDFFEFEDLVNEHLAELKKIVKVKS